MKICKKCEELKDDSEFYFQNGKPKSMCKLCYKLVYVLRENQRIKYNGWLEDVADKYIEKGHRAILLTDEDKVIGICIREIGSLTPMKLEPLYLSPQLL